MGYGSQSNFIDLIYFRAKDDSNSITKWKDPGIMQKVGDVAALRPAENNVIGVSSLVTIAKKFTVQVDGPTAIGEGL